MSYYIKKNVWLIGAGYMAEEYAKVLQAQHIEFEVFGRSERSAQDFYKKMQIIVKTGGVKKYINQAIEIPQYAIVAVSVDQLAETTICLLQYGIKKILVEKPAGLTIDEIKQIAKIAAEKNANVYIAYNRRFYASVKKAQEIIQEDGGVTSFHFEFTEWAHVIEKLDKPDFVKQEWFLANSTHVIDLAFYLGGKPVKMSAYKTGDLAWHKNGSIFSGAGVSENGALFSYQANWEAPGRWSVEVMTPKHRLIFKPLEKLQIQNIGSVATEFVDIDDTLDCEFKPGIYEQVSDFIQLNQEFLCGIAEHVLKCKQYLYMLNGGVYEENIDHY